MSQQFPPQHWHFSAWQKRVWNATRDLALPRLILMNCGRGAGKDIGALRCLFRDAFKLLALRRADADLVLVRNPLVSCAIVAPSEKSLKQTIRDLDGELRALARAWGVDDDEVWHHHRRENRYTLLGDISIEYLITSRPDSLRGPGWDLVLYTEFAAERRPAAYREELRGTLNRAGRLGRLYAYSTPKGPQGLFWNECKRVVGSEEALRSTINGQRLSESGLELYVHADAFQNEFLTAKQRLMISAESADGTVYEQERLALFVILDVSGSPVYRREWIRKCYVLDPLRTRPRNVIVGVDISRMGADWTVLLALDHDTGQILSIDRYQTTSGPEIVSYIEEAVRRYGTTTEIVYDATSHQAFVGDWLPSHLNARGIRVYERDKQRLVLGLRALLQMGRIRIPDPDRYPFESEEQQEAARTLELELLQYQRIVDTRGRVRYTHPTQTEHDDCLTALQLACDPILAAMQDDGGQVQELPEEFRALAGL